MFDECRIAPQQSFYVINKFLNCLTLSLFFVYFAILSQRKVYKAILRQVVGKSARDNPKKYCGWFRVHFSSKKFERMALEAMDICLRVLKESTTNKFDNYNRQEQCIDHIPCYLSGLSRAHFFLDNLSRNSCIQHAVADPGEGPWGPGLPLVFGPN